MRPVCCSVKYTLPLVAVPVVVSTATPMGLNVSEIPRGPSSDPQVALPASVVAFHLKAGAVHAQLVWPTSALLVL